MSTVKPELSPPGGARVEVAIDRDTCIGAGMCFATAPQIFDLDTEGKVALKGDAAVPDGLARAVEDAVALCPVAAIRIRGDG